MGVKEEVIVEVGVAVAVNVGVFVGLKLAVGEEVEVDVAVTVKLGAGLFVELGVGLYVAVKTPVGLEVGVEVAVEVGVERETVAVKEEVAIGVLVEEKVGLAVAVSAGVEGEVDVEVGVAAGGVLVKLAVGLFPGEEGLLAQPAGQRQDPRARSRAEIVNFAFFKGLSFPADRRDLLLEEFHDPGISLVGNIDCAHAVHRHVQRGVQVVGTRAQAPGLGDEISRVVEPLNAVVGSVRHKNVAGGIDVQPGGCVEIPVAAARGPVPAVMAPFPQGGTAGVEGHDPVVPAVGHDHVVVQAVVSRIVGGG